MKKGEKNKPKLEKRMYILVPYNISPIQQAIQAGHAVEQYARKYRDDPEYIDYIDNWKTWIVLDGGTTNRTRDFDGISQGTLNQIADLLDKNDIKFSCFVEPDLNDALTAVCLVVDERVFNRKDYPDYREWQKNYIETSEPINVIGYTHQHIFLNDISDDDMTKQYVSVVGEDIAFLKELLNTKKLA